MEKELNYQNDDIIIKITANDQTLECHATITILCVTNDKINNELIITQKGDDINTMVLHIKREYVSKIFQWKESNTFNRIKKLLFGSDKPVLNYVQTELFF